MIKRTNLAVAALMVFGTCVPACAGEATITQVNASLTAQISQIAQLEKISNPISSPTSSSMPQTLNSPASAQYGNYAVTYQQGNHNLSAIAQYGRGNSAVVFQIGNGNAASVFQSTR